MSDPIKIEVLATKLEALSDAVKDGFERQSKEFGDYREEQGKKNEIIFEMLNTTLRDTSTTVAVQRVEIETLKLMDKSISNSIEGVSASTKDHVKNHWSWVATVLSLIALGGITLGWLSKVAK